MTLLHQYHSHEIEGRWKVNDGDDPAPVVKVRVRDDEVRQDLEHGDRFTFNEFKRQFWDNWTAPQLLKIWDDAYGTPEEYAKAAKEKAEAAAKAEKKKAEAE